MKGAAEIYRIAIIKATFDELEQALLGRQKQVLAMKGSWKLRALGIGDAIEVIRAVQKSITPKTEKKEEE